MRIKFILWLFSLLVLATLNVLILLLYFSSNTKANDNTIVSLVRNKTKEYFVQAISRGKICEKHVRTKPLRVTNSTPSINASCTKLFAGDTAEVQRTRSLQEKWTSSFSDVEFLESITNCPEMMRSFSNNFYDSVEEKQFPLGFVLVVSYKENSVQQYMRLLRFLYRPQNVYCLHVDKKAPKIWIKHITAFASCFPNIILSRDAVEVVYASGSILTAHLNCLKELMLSKLPWKYAIDLHGTELPLVTNRDMVQALLPLKGVNSIVLGKNIHEIRATPDDINALKMTYKAVYVAGKGMRLTKEPLNPAPYNMTLYKSAESPNSAFSRNFVQFLLIDQRAIALASYLQDVLSAVEFYFNTLNNLDDAPGGRKDYERIKNSLVRMPIVANRNWRSTSYCHERYYVHNICILSVGDLQWLRQLSKKNGRPFFVNKYLVTYDHVVMDCMEEHLLKKNAQEYVRDCEQNRT